MLVTIKAKTNKGLLDHLWNKGVKALEASRYTEQHTNKNLVLYYDSSGHIATFNKTDKTACVVGRFV